MEVWNSPAPAAAQRNSKFNRAHRLRQARPVNRSLLLDYQLQSNEGMALTVPSATYDCSTAAFVRFRQFESRNRSTAGIVGGAPYRYVYAYCLRRRADNCAFCHNSTYL
jgi:hypothetical protein